MIFNSFQFAYFFIIVFGLYLLLGHKWQNRMLLMASYFFYSAWDWRFLSLIFILTILDYVCGIRIFESKDIKSRKRWLILSLVVSLLILGVFKYYNFFVTGFTGLFKFFGWPVYLPSLNIILPLGISFYTFQTMSYTIDIYRKKMAPTNQFFDFALFVAFFPTVISGPIERASNLLPQILAPRKVTIEKVCEGLYLIFWGLFQKIFVADNLAQIVKPIFYSYSTCSGAEILLGAYAYMFQVYSDFAGYSNIAKGLGSCMGFDITLNFNLPYFSTNPQDFWKRWHMSLTSWVRDYIYLPLFFSARIINGKLKPYIITIVTMLVIGIWHGASSNFIVWGLYHGLLLVIYILLRPAISNWTKSDAFISSKTWLLIRIIFMFHLLTLGGLIFRSASAGQALSMLHRIIFNFRISSVAIILMLNLILFSVPLILVELVQYAKKDLMAIYRLNIYAASAIYAIYFWLLITLTSSNGKEFIYFQF